MRYKHQRLNLPRFLEAMCRSFALKNPPQHGCLNSYGAGLPEFIKAFPPAKSLTYLSDMAALELAMNAAYYAADDKPLRAESLQNIAPENLPETQIKLRANIPNTRRGCRARSYRIPYI